jgi:DNA-binding SARP family transcriptional activator
VLALLVLSANEVVSVDRLIEGLWGGSAPGSATNIVQGYVSHLRKTLEPGRARGEHELLVSRPPGYELRIEPDQLDANRFERMSAEGRRLLAEGDAARAAERLRAALTLWRGPALSDLAFEPFARPEADRLEELRLAALEDRIDADLALGGEAALIGELRELVAVHPLRERLRGQLMLALYRAGRQAEALEEYRDARSLLSHELGIEPGPALRELERAILGQDPSLGGAGARPPQPVRSRPRRRRLIGAAGALGVVALASVLALVLATGESPRKAAPVTVYPHSVAVIDPASNAVVDDVIVGDYPSALAADARYVYVCNNGDATVSWILPAQRRVYGVNAFSRALDMIVDGGEGDLWAADGGTPGYTPPGVGPGTVLDSRPGPAPMTIKVGPSREGTEEQTTIAADGPDSFAVWVGNQNTATVREIDRLRDRTLRTIHGVTPGDLSVVGDASADTVWASDPSRNLVVRIDSTAGRVVGRTRVPDGPTGLAADRDTVWVATHGPHHALWRLSAVTGRLVARIPLPMTPRRVVLGAGSVWVSGNTRPDHHDGITGGVVVRIDPATNRIVAAIPLGDVAADGILVSHGAVWVAVPPSVER